MTPHHLHALAAAWSLQAARRTLAHLADAEAAQIAAEALEAPSVLRSTVYGGRHGSGGHSDPTPRMIAVAERPQRRNRWQEMADRATTRVEGIARLLGIAQNAPLARIRHAIPQLQPATALIVARHLDDEDTWIRTAIGQPRPTRPLPGDCPACRTRALEVHTAGPEDAWTVTCAGRWQDGVHNPCLCVGVGCPCGMPGAVEGVAHIWRRDDVLRAVAGAAPTRTH